MGNSVTIADVANHLGVSKSTVSHALSGKRRISSAVKRQVLEAVRELGYRPNFAARVMNTHRTGLVGVVVDSLNNPHTTALLEELGRELARYSMQMVLCSAGEVENGRLLLSKFSNGMVDGILNNLPGLAEDEARELAHGVPLITYLRHREAPLTIDFAAGTRQALDYLAGLGHRRIAMIPAEHRGGAGEDPCLIAYREQFGDSGLVFRTPAATLQAGLEVAEALFASDATAVLAGNDAVASGLLQWAIARNYPLPERMSVIGHDDSPLASLTFPSLTSLRLPIDVIAAHTVKVLMHAIDREQPVPEPLTIVPELIVRNSCAARTQAGGKV